ncbi:triple QxxK/R motif-containing protein-like isoform X1 [Schistocerca nitens]|uniref:triple QxxK/R motif-containing protein-like isoform X1 n=2 Tax=Schistocerca TaxID=7008 RepID=UPI00211904BB|nr:triple QxxK/R motif-containing protein-like isoform X1 [Schistocerca nitens]
MNPVHLKVFFIALLHCVAGTISMARSRHDSTGSTPVEQYRKQIARQDSKKSKEIMRETKHRAEKKENAPAQYKEVSIMVGAMLALCVCVYCIFYALLADRSH